MKSKFYAPYNKIVIEVDETTFDSFQDVVYEEFNGFKLIGTPSFDNQRCFHIIKADDYQTIMHPLVGYQLINKYRSFRSANRRFQKLKMV